MDINHHSATRKFNFQFDYKEEVSLKQKLRDTDNNE